MNQSFFDHRNQCSLRAGSGFVAVLCAFLVALSTPLARAGDYVLVVDTSGSMKGRVSGKDSRVRISVVQAALREYLPALPLPSRVYLIAFSTGIVSEKEVLLKDQTSLTEALTWANGLGDLAKRGGDTHLWTTLRKALQVASSYSQQDPSQPVVVRVLTDGEDTERVTTLDRVLKEFPLVDGERIRGNLVLLGDLEIKTKLSLPEGAFETTKNTRWSDLFPPVILCFPSQPKAGEEVRLAENTRSIYAEYQWHIDNKPVGDEKILNWRFPEARTYRVTLKVKGIDGSANANTILVRVAEKDVFSVGISASHDSVQPGEQVRFIARPSARAEQFSWFIDGKPFGTGDEFTFRPAAEGDIQVKVIARNSEGSNATNTVVCTVKELPLTAHIRAPAQATAGQAVQFASQISGPVAGVLWEFGDGESSTEMDPVHGFALNGRVTGEFTVSLRVTSPAGRVVEASPQVVRVQSLLAPQAPRAAFKIVEQQIREGDTLHMIDQSEGHIETRQWEMSGHVVSRERSPSIRVGKSGKHTVTLKVAGSVGADQATQEITVQPRFERVSMKVVASRVSGPTPLGVQFTSHVVGEASSIHWDFGDGQSSTNWNPHHEFVRATNYTVVATIVPLDPTQSQVQEKMVLRATTPLPVWLKLVLVAACLLCALGAGLCFRRRHQREKLRLTVCYWPEDATVCQRVDLTATNEVTKLGPSVPLQVHRIGDTAVLAVQPLEGAILMSSDGREVSSLNVGQGARVLVKTPSGSLKAVAIAANTKPQRPLPASQEVAEVAEPVAAEPSSGGDFDWRW